MHSSSKKPPSFKKGCLEIAPSIASLPFMFSVGINSETQPSTSSSDRKSSENDLKFQKLKSSFKQELQKLGVSAKLIPEKNHLKESLSKNNSPRNGLPFQRRARSSSPPKEELKVANRKSIVMFAPRSPVVGLHKMKFREDFTGLCRDSGNYAVEEDEDLKKLKEEYRKMLEGAKFDFCDDDSDEIGDEGEIEEIESQVGVSQKRYFK